MKKYAFLVVAVQLMLLANANAQSCMKEEIPDGEYGGRTKLMEPNIGLVEKPAGFTKKGFELSSAKTGSGARILYRAYSSAFDDLVIRQNPAQGPELNETTREAAKEAEALAGANQANEYEGGKFKWDSAIRQSLLFLGFQHGLRFTQRKTIDELRGPFFRDYLKAIKGVRSWDDGDGFITNYLGHPAMGAVSGYIQIQNDPKATKLVIGRSKEYWNSRLKAMAWSAAYSTQFEIGLLSEATIGNVGKKPGTGGYVDFVITPALGTAGILLEDTADSFLINKIEKRTRNPHVIRLVRMALNPTRSFANVLRFKKPWHRDGRRLNY
jgi:hypothetical protein